MQFTVRDFWIIKDKLRLVLGLHDSIIYWGRKHSNNNIKYTREILRIDSTEKVAHSGLIILE